MSGVKILLVEPDEYYHAKFQEHCQDLGELILTTSYAEAKQQLKNSHPDIIIMELLLPDDFGYQLLADLKAVTESNLPVIIFSQMQNLQDIQAALSLGVSGYFVKGKNQMNEIRQLLLTLVNA